MAAWRSWAMAGAALAMLAGNDAIVALYTADAAVAALAATLLLYAAAFQFPDGVQVVSAGALRPGDLIRVSSGEVVPADARILSAESVEVDESALTGESLPVPKSTAATPGAPMAERSGVLYSGTTMIACFRP